MRDLVFCACVVLGSLALSIGGLDLLREPPERAGSNARLAAAGVLALLLATLSSCTIQRLVVLDVPPDPDGGRCVVVNQHFDLGTINLHDLFSRPDGGR